MMLPRPSATVWNIVVEPRSGNLLVLFPQGDFGVLLVLPSTVADTAPASFALSASAPEAAEQRDQADEGDSGSL